MSGSDAELEQPGRSGAGRPLASRPVADRPLTMVGEIITQAKRDLGPGTAMAFGGAATPGDGWGYGSAAGLRRLRSWRTRPAGACRQSAATEARDLAGLVAIEARPIALGGRGATAQVARLPSRPKGCPQAGAPPSIWPSLPPRGGNPHDGSLCPESCGTARVFTGRPGSSPCRRALNARASADRFAAFADLPSRAVSRPQRRARAKLHHGSSRGTSSVRQIE